MVGHGRGGTKVIYSYCKERRLGASAPYSDRQDSLIGKKLVDLLRIAKRRRYYHSIDTMRQEFLDHFDLVTTYLAFSHFDLYVMLARVRQTTRQEFTGKCIARIVEQQSDAQLFANGKSSRGEVGRVF